jgi:hypothetical protein
MMIPKKRDSSAICCYYTTFCFARIKDFILLANSPVGIGDTVLVNREGNGARQALKILDGCVISVILGFVNQKV